MRGVGVAGGDSITMQFWNRTVKTALIGTERQAPDLSGAPDEIAALIQGGTAETQLLEAAAAVALYRRAGRCTEPVEGALVAAAEPETLAIAPLDSIHDLLRMLRGEHQAALPEWLATAATRGWVVPPAVLPEALEFGHRHTAYRSGIAALMGSRGRWLAAMNPDWQYALQLSLFEAPNPAASDALKATWETGTPEERLGLFRAERSSAPNVARERIAATWEQETPEMRRGLLALMETGLSLSDEPFLERALDDRRKEVRSPAQRLLALLPDSQLCSRMWERCRRLVRFEKRGLFRNVIEIDLPDRCDEAMERDGLEMPQSDPDARARAILLRQMIQRVPLRRWREAWKQTPDRLIEMAAGTSEASPWSPVLLQGWAEALRRYPDRAWALPLWRYWWEKAGRVPPLEAAWDSLLPPDAFEAGVLHFVRTLDYKKEYDSIHELIKLMARYRGPWSEEFTRKFMGWLMGATEYHPLVYAVARFLPAMPPPILLELCDTMEQSRSTGDYLRGQIAAWRDFEQFRTEMRRRLKPRSDVRIDAEQEKQ